MSITRSAIEDSAHLQEAVAAFAHEIRTPLTALKMLVELGRRAGTGGDLVFDIELGRMLEQSIADLETLVDQTHETSRLARGLLALNIEDSDLGTVLDATRALLPDGPVIPPVVLPPDTRGRWDVRRLAEALATFARTVERFGGGSGSVDLLVSANSADITLEMTSGTGLGERLPVDAEAGFAFFRAWRLVLAMQGSVDCERFEKFGRVRCRLPRAHPSPRRR